MKGAFTGAMVNKQGLFEIADNGSMFLDEIGEMPVNLQVKLLRVLEHGTFRRLGGTTDITVDVRVVSATNKDLKEEIKGGRFREDLFYRLNVFPIHIPPLRERKEDIPLLIVHFLEKASKIPKRVSPDAMRVLIDCPWKGNVRELENIIERVALLVDKQEITLSDLPLEITAIAGIAGETGDPHEFSGNGVNLDSIIEEIEKKYILKALERTNGVKTEAAKLLNLTFRSFRHRLQKYGLK
jgi:two-component system response regulator PilR (NtrC family)